MLRAALLATAFLAAVGLPTVAPAWFQPVDHTLQDWRTRLAVTSKWLGNTGNADSLIAPHGDSKLAASTFFTSKGDAPLRAESRIVIVDVDERSLGEQGAWPWPRDRLAQLLQTLIDHYGVSAVAIDMVLPEPRRDEAALAVQLRREQVTGAVVFDLERHNMAGLGNAPFAMQPGPALQHDALAPALRGVPVVANHGALLPRRAGHITPLFDLDRTVRRLPPLLCGVADGSCVPTLALASFAGLLDAPQFRLHAAHGLFAPAWLLDVVAGGTNGEVVASLPLDQDGTLTVPYRHLSAGWISISATDILNARVDPALLKGTMVLIGSTALGLSDVIATPFKSGSGGFEPHAEILSALLDNDFAYVPRWGWLLDGTLLLPLGLLLAALAMRAQPSLQQVLVFPLWLATSWALLAAVAVLALSRYGLLLPLVPLLLFPPLAVLFIILAELYNAGRLSSGVLALLGAYLPRSVARRLERRARMGLAGSGGNDIVRREITVVFADVRGFSAISENHTPEVVGALMQRVFAEMAEAVALHDGTIDKFIGDAIMAFWNAPDDDPAHAAHAVAAAQEIQRRIAGLADYCVSLGIAPLQVGIGIETGEALVGNFGTRHRTTYTALGEPVVLASRLEGLASGVGGTSFILVGGHCAAALQPATLRPLGRARIRGRQHELDLYTLPDQPVYRDAPL